MPGLIAAAIVFAAAPVAAQQQPSLSLSASDARAARGCPAHYFQVYGLPAVETTQGVWVASAYRAEDGGRGNPNLEIQVRDVRTDRVVQVLPILAPAEVDDLDCMTLMRLVLRRIDDAIGWLSPHQWRPLVALEAVDDHVARLAPIDVVYREPTLAIREPSVRVHWQRTFPRWTAPRGRRCHGCQYCAPTAVLDSAWLDAQTGTFLFRIAYRSGDLCDTDGTLHVIRLPSRTATRIAARLP